MASVRRGVLAVCLGVALCFTDARAADVAGSKDHPLLSRYAGSAIDDYSVQEYVEYTLPLGKPNGDVWTQSQRLEGKVTRIRYVAPEGRSALEVFRNYEKALKSGGFTVLFSCSGGAQCGGSQTLGWCPGCSPQQVTAKLSRSAGDVWVSVHVEQDNPGTPARAQVDVVEVKPMEGGLVTVNAESLGRDLASTGHASVYGIYFDTGKADVKPESDATLREIAKLLHKDASLKLYVVGHTDNQGTLATNMELSRQRADTVVKVLVAQYSVNPARLSAQGDGPTAPVASNDTEAGRAKNRRVELVKQ